MVLSVEHTLSEKLSLVEDRYRKASVMKVHVDECLAKMELWLSEAEDAATEATNAIDEFVATEDADDWLPLIEESGTSEIFTLVERMREMLS